MRAFEAFVARRYLETRRKGAFVRVMVAFARVGTALGVFAMVLTLAVMNGFHEEIQANLFSATAHFTVSSLTGDFTDTRAALEAIRAVPGVKAASPIRFERALLRPTGLEAPPEALAVKAIDPATAHQTSRIFDSVRPGRVEDLKPGDILVGVELAKNLGLRVGDTVAIAFFRLDLGLSGLQPRMMAFRIAGIFQSHIAEYDARWAFIHLEDAQALARTDQAEMIEVRAEQLAAIDRVKPAVLEALRGIGVGAPVATDLRDTNRALFAALKLEKWLFSAAFGLIVLVAAFNIVASLVLLVTEKRQDLGVLLALGATPKQIQRLFEWQGLRIGAVGTLWGLALSVPLCWILDRYRLVNLPKSVYDFITYVPFRLYVGDVVLVALFPILVAWLASRYPARRAARVNPVEALRAE